jgi:hypothetical protein
MHASFRVIRLLEDRLIASDFVLDCVIDILPTSNTAEAKDRIKAMRLWLDEYLDGAIAFGVNTEISTETLEAISNSVLMCPDDPHDYLLLLLIHSKLDAIAGDTVVISRTNMISDTGEGFSNSVEGTAEDWLPSMADWMGPRSYHDRPWWSRSDSSTVDMKHEEGEDLKQIPELGIDLIEAVRSTRPDTGENKPVADIVKPAFKPRVLTPDD